MTKFIVLFISLSIIGSSFLSPAAAFSPNFKNQSNTQKIIEMTNNERLKNNLKPLKLNSSLTSATSWHVSDMLSNNYFSHTDSLSRTYGERLSAFGYPYLAGENIASAFTVSDIFTLWMNSQTHLDNILGNYQEIGVSATGVGILIASQAFGSRSGEIFFPVVINAEDATTKFQGVTIFVGNSRTDGCSQSISEIRMNNNGGAWSEWIHVSEASKFVPGMDGFAAFEWTLQNLSGNQTVFVEVKTSCDPTVYSFSDTIHLIAKTPQEAKTISILAKVKIFFESN